MKITLLGTIGLLLSITTALAQETIAMGAGYTEEIYYSLADGEIAAEEIDTWDISFEVSGRGSAIRTNDGKFVELYVYDGPITDFETLDTSGIATWQKKNNQVNSWSEGAFSQDRTSDSDLGWGIYNVATHFITGDSIYVLKTRNDVYKKIYVKSLTGGVYTVVSGPADNSAPADTFEIDKNDYSNVNFAYYDFASETASSREPDSDTWDLLFTRYGYSPFSASFISAGVLINPGLEVSNSTGAPAADLTENTATYSTETDAIGKDWKSLNFADFSWIVEDSSAYFIRNANQDVFKLVFTSFAGTRSGEIGFEITQTVTGLFDNNNATTLGAYPNPTTGLVNISEKARNVRVHNTLGSLVEQVTFSNGQVNLTNVPTGVYVVTAEINGITTTSKISKR